MIRVVLDTNIIVSAHPKPGSLPDAVLNLALNGFVALRVSDAVLAEYEEVLSRPRLRINPAIAADVITRIKERSVVVYPAERISVSADPDDNLFLECAKCARADFLITGNLRDFPPAWENTRIISVREFFEWILRSPSA
jgi:putative PIN family toxin of toxin-antitoxin system